MSRDPSSLKDLFSQLLSLLTERRFDEVLLRLEAEDLANIPAPPFSHITGLALLGAEQWDKARSFLTTAVTHAPDDPSLAYNLALALEKTRSPEQAIAFYERSLSLAPQSPTSGAAHLALCHLYRARQNLDTARTCADLAEQAGVPQPNLLNARGLIESRAGNYAAAATFLDSAIASAPDEPLYKLNRANLAIDARDEQTAWPLFASTRTYPAAAPSAARDEAMARLLLNDRGRGLPLYEERLRIPFAFSPPDDLPRWTGERTPNLRLLIVAEQGQGDTLHFCRYEAALLARSIVPLWWVQPSLVSLLSLSLSGEVVGKDTAPPQAEFYLPLLSLPLLLDDPATDGAPYLIPPATGPLLPQGSGRKIGFVGKGSPTHERDALRSLPNSLIETLPALFPTDTIYNVSVTDGPLAPLIHDWSDTAYLLKQLDFLLTVDTATAHLAGALGVKTYLFLPYSPDWRWGLTGDKTHLYQSVTLLRQQRPNDWESLFSPALMSRLSK